MLEGIRGRVIEIGAGNGMNFSHYPEGVTAVVAVEPDPYLRKLALGSAQTAPVPVEVIDGLAESLPGEDSSFDAAVMSLVLCSVDQDRALREVRRLLKPGGELRFLEHVAAESPILNRVQRLVDATVWPSLFGGCHTHRDTLAAVAGAGFSVDHVERFSFPESGLSSPASPCVAGVARRI
jgi:ubiquinone/menaquinone biosynthesis C-methylase UbiE